MSQKQVKRIRRMEERLEFVEDTLGYRFNFGNYSAARKSVQRNKEPPQCSLWKWLLRIFKPS